MSDETTTTKMGRPTKYDPSLCEKVDEYLALKQDEYKQIIIDTGEGEPKSVTKLKVSLPTVSGFSLFLDVNESTLYEWKGKYEDFSKSLGKIVKEQKDRLVDMGLSGEYNSTIAKLILSSNHGMSDKIQHDASEDLIDALHGKQIN